MVLTVTLAPVYVPMVLQAELTGLLFREFAFTLAGAVDLSHEQRQRVQSASKCLAILFTAFLIKGVREADTF